MYDTNGQGLAICSNVFIYFISCFAITCELMNKAPELLLQLSLSWKHKQDCPSAWTNMVDRCLCGWSWCREGVWGVVYLELVFITPSFSLQRGGWSWGREGGGLPPPCWPRRPGPALQEPCGADYLCLRQTQNQWGPWRPPTVEQMVRGSQTDVAIRWSLEARFDRTVNHRSNIVCSSSLHG